MGVRQNGSVQIPAKADYAIRALLTLAESERSISAEHLAQIQGLPPKFLGSILSELRRGEIVASQRGAEGGFRLAKPADQIAIADVLRVLGGPMAGVRGMRPETLDYEGPAANLRDVWVAVRASLRAVLEHVTIADVVSGHLPKVVTDLTSDPDAWHSRS
jgi:Rrf2 family protein